MLLALLLLTANAYATNAQTFNELFRQKKTQQRYLLRQLAALQGYVQILHTGYRQLQEGLEVIGQLQTTSSGLQHAWFNRLFRRSDNTESVAALGLLQRLQEQARGLLHKRVETHLSPPQWDAFRRYIQALIQASEKDARELWLLTRDGTLRFKAADRMRLIHGLYQQVKMRCQHFYQCVAQLQHFSAAQARHQLAASFLEQWYSPSGR